MTEKIQIQVEELDFGQIKESIKCPKHQEIIHANKCKRCKHCRIYLGDYVKCSFNNDAKKEEKEFVQPVYIL